MWPFRRRPLLDDETAAWHAENFAWLIGEFGAGGGFDAAPLVLPTKAFFTAEGEEGHSTGPVAIRPVQRPDGPAARHARALHIFEQVKAHAGLTGWPVELVADDNPAAREPTRLSLGQPVHGALAQGTFSIAGNAALITYTPALVADPQRLIATFAHELAHYLLAARRSEPPCEADELEFLTDLTAVMLGFGVFMANSVFAVETMRDGTLEGWRMRRSGYLPEHDLVFDLALFIAAKELDPAPAVRHLKPHLGKLLQRALRGFEHDPRWVEELRRAMETPAG
jgi:hypothetical protein